MTAQNRDWLATIARLNLYKASGGAAPHKPLLLLVVFELAARGELSSSLRLTPELAFRFCAFWSVVAYRRRQRPDVRFPFFHLKSEGFWTPLDERGEAATDFKRAATGLLDADFLRFAGDPAARQQAQRLLIARYFQPQERAALYSLVGMEVPSDDAIAADANYQALDAPRRRGRAARFRLDIVAAYNYTCALTGLRLTTITAGSIVDAAHIHPFARSQNDDPRNGMALSKNAHWLFDHGLWSLDDEYRVLVAGDRFAEACPDQKPLADYAGERLRLPSDERLWPDPIHLAWHRKHRFLL